MFHPPKKIIKSIASQFNSGTALLIGKEVPDLPRLKQGRLRDNKHARSLISKDRFIKLEDIQLQLGSLRVGGKQIGSSLNMEPIRLKPRGKNSNSEKIVTDFPKEAQMRSAAWQKPWEEDSKGIKLEREKKYAQRRTQALDQLNRVLKQTDHSKEKQLESIEPKAHQEELNSNQISQKKENHYQTAQRKSDREGASIGKTMKRRDTMVQTSNINGQNQLYLKNTQEFKKAINLIQYRQFLLAINLTNRFAMVPVQQEVQYKVYVCKGNNGLLVKSILKTRPWWVFRAVGQIDNCNLVWTEWKRNKTMNQLTEVPSREPNKNEELPETVQITTKNKEIREKMEKKLAIFSKVVGNNTNIYKKYDSSMLSENYLTFTSKISQKSFETIAAKALKNEDSPILSVDSNRKVANHVPGCLFLHSKKLLFQSMLKYYKALQKDVFSVIPLTFLITKGLNDPEFQKFCQYYQDQAARSKGDKKNSNVWICKPGQNSNRGNGIEVVRSLNEIKSLVSQKCGSSRSLIIQKYMQNPFLYNKRKFDIRCYILITCCNGCVKGYWYEQGYGRTASKEYTLKNLENKMIHLTNDAIQKKGEEYGKFEGNNKISFAELQKYIESNSEMKFKIVYQKIKTISTHLIESVAKKINPHHKEYSFEVFGLDFMLDDKLNPFLIEANSNPCLQVDGNVLGRVIPRMIENVIRVAIDPIFPPPYSQTIKNKYSPGSTFQMNQMVLVYDSLHDTVGQSKEEAEQMLAIDKQAEQFEGEDDQV